jgi:hypothetical protein
MVAKERVVRAAPCTLSLKGRTELTAALKAEGGARKKRIVEEFTYTLPGRLTETLYPKGETEFTFTPDVVKPGSGAEAVLHLEDDWPANGMAPVTMDARDLQSAGVMVFKALTRGQVIVPLGGAVVNLRGSLKSLAPMTVPAALPDAGNRPVASTPFPKIDSDLRKPGLPVMRFEGLSLWSWANAPTGVTLNGSVAYSSVVQKYSSVNGTITFTFKIGAVEKAKN